MEKGYLLFIAYFFEKKIEKIDGNIKNEIYA